MDRDGVGRKVTKKRLFTNIYETSKTSVGLPVGPVSDAVGMFHLVLGKGRGLIAPRNQIEARAVEFRLQVRRLPHGRKVNAQGQNERHSGSEICELRPEDRPKRSERFCAGQWPAAQA